MGKTGHLVVLKALLPHLGERSRGRKPKAENQKLNFTAN
jgi:hypothetical protein